MSSRRAPTPPDPRDPLDGEYRPVPLSFTRLDPAEALARSRDLLTDLRRRKPLTEVLVRV